MSAKKLPAIGDVLNSYRRIWNCPPQVLAKAIGISVPTLYRIESGKPPDGSTVIKLFYFLFSSERGKA